MAELTRLLPHSKDLGGGFVVRRLLPSAQRQAVGPFVFFDHFGPITARPGDDHDVRPHPHIGLATVTYLFDGAMMHRDSTGVVQRIEPGAINWMTAGGGIVHSERTPDDLRQVDHTTHGLQLWAALPEANEEDPCSFGHTPASAIPELQVGGATVRVLIGEAFGVASPVRTLSPTLYLGLKLAAGAAIVLAAPADERAVYGVDGGFSVGGVDIEPNIMVVLEPGSSPELRTAGGCRLVLVGGTPLGHRHIWWNFVSSRRARIEQAKDDWLAQRMGRVAGDPEFIPLPSR